MAIISTGNELIAPGETMRPPHVFDSNAQILADSVRELGGLPRSWGIVRDDADALRQKLHAALAESDVVLLSGGTSKGQGDLCYRVVAELTDPGIVAHGVALKPGKPICLAASGGKPVVILPGFPTSAIFTFHEFVAPVICLLGGRRPESQELVSARMAVKMNSEIGRTEYLLVSLVHSETGLVAYPMGKGSGSVTTFSRADGFVTIGRHTEIVEAGQQVEVRPIGRGLQIADLVVIGSHCVGLDFLLSKLQQRGVTSKLITVGSSAGSRGRPPRRVRPGRHSFARSRNGRVQPAVSDGRHDARWKATADARESSIVAATSDSKGGRSTRSSQSYAAPIRIRIQHPASCHDGQPQPRQRHAHLDRSTAGRRPTTRLRRSGQQSQRRRRRRRARPRRLGTGDRIGGPQQRSGISSVSGRAVRLCHPEGTPKSDRQLRRLWSCLPTSPPTAASGPSLDFSVSTSGSVDVPQVDFTRA